MSSAEGRQVDQADTPNGRSCHQRNGLVDKSRLPADPKLTLHPASFDDDAHPEEDLDAAASGTRPSLSQTTQGRAGRRRTTLRDVLDDGTNPFLPDRREARPPGQPAFRQELYPGYDGTGRRIGLEHLRGSGAPPRQIGHYRQHVHEYDAGGGYQHPVPPHHRPAPLYPLSISQHLDVSGNASAPGIGSVFPGMQTPRKTPHEILGLPPGAPLDLSSLQDPLPGEKPQYHYHVLMKLAILGTSSQRATLQEILTAIRGRFSYYQMLGKKESTAFGNSVRHSLSLLSAFIRVPKPATEPGKGAYWTVDFSKGEGNKRERKRNTKHKTKINKNKDNGMSSNPSNDQRLGLSGSDADDSDDNLENGSAFAQEPISPPSTRVQARYERMPASRAQHSRKAIVTTAGPGGEVQQHGGNDFYNCIDPMLMGESLASDQNYAQPLPQTHVHPRSAQSGVGAHRGRMSRGVARSSPYPTPLIMSSDVNSVGTGSGPESGSSGEGRLFPSHSPADGSGYHTSVSPQSVGTPPLPYQSAAFGASEHFQGGPSSRTVEYVYASQFPHPQSSHYSSESPQGSPSVDPPGLPNFAGARGRTPLPPSQLVHQFQPELPGHLQTSATGISLSPSSTYFSQGPTSGVSSLNPVSGSGPGGSMVNGSFSRLTPTGFLPQEPFPFLDPSHPTNTLNSLRPHERRDDSLYMRGTVPPAARSFPSRASPRNRDARH